MEIQLIRNATLKLNYAGKNILIDPMLCPKDTFPPFVKGLKKNPTIGLNIPIEEILKQVDAVLVTHSHPDHFDELSKELIPKDVKLFCTPTDKDHSLFNDFKTKEVVHKKLDWDGITIERTEGQHGSGPVLQYMGEVSGYLLKSKNEPTLYIVSDSILTEEIIAVIKAHKPDVVICNSGGGIFPGLEKYPVMLDEKQTIDLANVAPDATLIAVHLEAIDFCRVSRQSLRTYADNNGLSGERLRIPQDGEVLKFSK